MASVNVFISNCALQKHYYLITLKLCECIFPKWDVNHFLKVSRSLSRVLIKELAWAGILLANSLPLLLSLIICPTCTYYTYLDVLDPGCSANDKLPLLQLVLTFFRLIWLVSSVSYFLWSILLVFSLFYFLLFVLASGKIYIRLLKLNACNVTKKWEIYYQNYL